MAGLKRQAPQTTSAKERARIVASFRLFDVPPAERAEILEALDSPLWDWFNDCDGCTCVSEDFWPTRYFPPCIRHDFDWRVGNPIAPSNARFYRLSRRYRMTRLRAAVRWLGVTASWALFFRWKPSNRAAQRARRQRDQETARETLGAIGT